ncbi:hypothetical protein CROQUDRAFT_49717 [Cronartium quercuum f. sp. fusiforme G11]|uniref:trimethyllysine dioxygenase n=1 Tax=Cronartium quercuum f. sp. fusiforme G11 TaxID=708437 RepID=A0A9P6NBE5_9BASI|nr:hypothetical protein CROQUDRAFT_49717 [Cronartium quercuum f. sp. fusiforme G11]
MYFKFPPNICSRFLASGRRGIPQPISQSTFTSSLSACASLSTNAASLPAYHGNCRQTPGRILPMSPHPVQQSFRSRQTTLQPGLARNPCQRPSFHFSRHADHLRVDFGDGKNFNFQYFWLRDNCRCASCFHQFTKQRLLDSFQIPLDISPTDVQATRDGLTIQWPDGHRTLVPFTFLKKHSHDSPLGDTQGTCGSERTFWDRSIEASMPAVRFEALFQKGETGDRAVLEWLRNINRFGFCLVDGVPLEPAMTEKLLCRIAFIRETHYGAFWDFTANMEHGDTAYTNLPLGAHTDTTYFSDPAGLQLFHLLSPAESHTGGRSLLVDGFAAASRLKESQPWAYETLARVPIDTHASGGDGVAFRPLLPTPVLSHHPRSGELLIVRWNPDDRRPLKAKNGDEIQRWYSAAREWEKIIRSPEMELWTQMKMGQALIFDNQRVLHGRSGFTGSRRICGGYINGDDYRSRLRSLEHQFSKEGSNTFSDNVWHEID